MFLSNVFVETFSILTGFFLENSFGFVIVAVGDFKVDPNFLTDLQGARTFIEGFWLRILGDDPLKEGLFL